MSKTYAEPNHLADAYEHVARVNHYLVGVVSGINPEIREAAEQVLITRQNDEIEGSKWWAILELALDILEHDRKRERTSRCESPV